MIIGVSILSIWKIVLINTEYSQPSIEEKCMGEVIAITPDVDLKVLSMRIQSIDNINCDEKTKKAIKEIGENVKVANIEVEIKNQGLKDNLIKIYDWVLQNKVWSNGINMELFYGENEKNIDLEILLEKTTCKKIILPFLIYDFQMKKSQWDTLHVSVDYLLQDSLEENSSELSISIEVRSEKEKTLIYSIVDGLRKGLDNFE